MKTALLQLEDKIAPVLPLPVGALASFRRRMQHEGWEVDLARMCVDAAYACECLALAHASSDAALRRSALDLFATYDRNAVAGPLH